MKYFPGLVLLSLLAQGVQAADKADFAFGYTLEVDGDGAIYMVELPQAVYQGMTRADRGDLRVFNSQGVAVPHYLKRAEQHSAATPPPVSVPIFPLYDESTTPVTGEGYRLHVTTDERGAIIDINYGKTNLQARRLSGYLIDASQLEQTPTALQVYWPETQGDFVTSLVLERSDDLANWQTLVKRSTISNLHYAEHTLIQQRIEIPPHRYRYLRLTWQSSLPVELSRIEAQFPLRYQAQERKWTRFNVTQTDASRHIYEFDTGAVLPADRLNIELPQRNSLIRVYVESAGAPDGPWLLRYSGLLYDLNIEGNPLRTPDIWFNITTHRYWRLRVLNDGSQLNGEPQLRLGWIPEQLLFVAQGEAPFVLGYGSGAVGMVDSPLPQLLGVAELKQQELIKPARLGSQIRLGDTSRLTPPEPPTDWKRFSLWGVLIIAVMLLAWMALRLYREMEQSG